MYTAKSFTKKQRANLSAALRHLRDAAYLHTGLHRSDDQAWHLVGFVPECLRKACLFDLSDEQAKVLGHDLSSPGEALLDWLLGLDARGWRYGLRDWASLCGALERWTPNARYDLTGTTANEGRALDALLAFSQDQCERLVAELWQDGLLDTPEI